jgi:hypothetical protein
MLSAQNLILGRRGNYLFLRSLKLVVIAQLVRASDCGSEGRGFEPHWPPFRDSAMQGLFVARSARSSNPLVLNAQYPMLNFRLPIDNRATNLNIEHLVKQ